MENDNKNLINEGYYSSKSRKVGDFFIGYIGFFAVGFVSYFLMSSMASIMDGINIADSFFGTILIYLSATFIVGLPIIAIIFANVKTKKTRRYITKGINFALITLILIPVILFGACLLALGNYHGG